MKNIVRYLRRSQEFDWTQDELAEKVGVSRATISAIENGASTSVEVSIRIAKVFNRDVREIFLTPMLHRIYKIIAKNVLIR